MQGDLDQLWYTWSKNGLDSMAMGYRVRAASGDLRNTQGMRYRVLDRFLRYEPPQGLNINEFDARTAPTSYAFISNGQELLLIRKVFKGRDLAGRNSVFFTHLVAGLPDTFTMRDAIRLWDCPELWVDSEEQKAPNDTQLDPVPYALLKRYADRPQPAPALPFAAIRPQLESLLLAILAQNGFFQKITLVGHSRPAAALIYGLTHCLPLTLLGHNFTFSTYESTLTEIEATIVTTTTGAELANPTYLEMRLNDLPPVSPADAQRYKTYVETACNYLLSNSGETFLNFLKRMEAHDCRNAEQLIEEFNLAFGQGPLTFKQVETILTHAAEYADKLRDPLFQHQSATLLAEQEEYWLKQGQRTFQHTIATLVAGPTQPDPARQALATYLNGVATSLFSGLCSGLLQAKMLEAQGQNPWPMVKYYQELLTVLLPPAYNEPFWRGVLGEFKQPQYQSAIKTDALWPVQLWLLDQARKLPQPKNQQDLVQPWLEISSWEKLEKALALNLPPEWCYAAIYGRLQNIPQSALPAIQKHEPLFIATLQQLLRQGGKYLSDVVAFFQSMVKYRYPNATQFLLALVNTYPEFGFVQTIFASVGLKTPNRLQPAEITTVLIACSPEVIATCNRSLALAEYIQEFLLELTPAKLNTTNASQLLSQIDYLSGTGSFPPLAPINASLASHWLIMNKFIKAPNLDRHLLAKTETAIKHILHSGSQARAQQLIQPFADEFVPILAQKASTEADLEAIMDTLGQSMTGSRWDLLRWIAILTGQTKTRPYELLPYAASGMREAERTGKTQVELNQYLNALFPQQDKELLKKIDTALNNEIWPDSFRQKWESWRSSHKKGISMPSMPFVRSSTGRLPAPQQPITLPALNNSAATPASSREQINLTLPAQNVFPSSEPAQQTIQLVASLPDLKSHVSREAYSYVHKALPLLLPYWLDIKLQASRKDHLKSLNFEIRTLRLIHEDLRTIPNQTSLTLVAYLAEDILLADVIQRYLAPDSVAIKTLDPDRYLPSEITSFFNYMQEQKQEQVSFAHEALYYSGLRPLIRRYLLINHLEEQKKSVLRDIISKKDLQAFLERERPRIHFL